MSVAGSFIYLFIFGCTMQHSGILVPQPGIKPHAVEVQYPILVLIWFTFCLDLRCSTLSFNSWPLKNVEVRGMEPPEPVKNPCKTLQSFFCICRPTSADATTESCSTVVFTVEENLCMSGLVQFKLILFKVNCTLLFFFFSLLLKVYMLAGN